MGLFGGPSADKILAKGSPVPGQIVGIRVRYVSDEDTTRTVQEWAVDVPGTGTLGIRQSLTPDERVRLGMGVTVVVHEGAGVIDWAATASAAGFEGTTTTHRYKALKDVPAPGIVDEEAALASARKKGEPVAITITALDERSFLGGMATRLTATVTVVLAGTEPFQAEIKGIAVPGYASHLIAVGRTLPGFVKLRRLDKPVIDWAAAANADPGLGVEPARPRVVDEPQEATRTPLDDGQGVRTAIDAAANGEQRFGGLDLATYAAIEAGLQRHRVRPDAYDAYAVSKGMPVDTTWAQASAAWQAAIRTDWTLGAAFGEAFEAARQQR